MTGGLALLICFLPVLQLSQSRQLSSLVSVFLLCLPRTLCPPAPQLLLCILTFLLIFLQQTSAPEGHPLFTVSRVQPCDGHVVGYGWLWIMNGFLRLYL